MPLLLTVWYFATSDDCIKFFVVVADADWLSFVVVAADCLAFLAPFVAADWLSFLSLLAADCLTFLAVAVN